jgi:hypothetical protein
MAAGGRLVGDDRVIAWASGGRLFVCGHPRLAGLVEARGVGVVPAPHLAFAEVALVCDLVAQGVPERVPEPASVVIEGVPVKRTALFAGEDSAPAKLDFALRDATLGARPEASYLTPSADEAAAPVAEAGASQEE